MAQQKVKGRQVSVNLDDLNDVDAAAPNPGDSLAFDGAAWVPTPVSGGGDAFFQVAEDADATAFVLDCNNFNFPFSNVDVAVGLTGPLTVNPTGVEFASAPSFQEYAVTATAAPLAIVTEGYTFTFTVARVPGSIGAAWRVFARHSDTGPYGSGHASWSMDYQSHAASPAARDRVCVRDDNYNILLSLVGDGLWPTDTSSRDIEVRIAGSLLTLIIKAVSAGSFVVGRQYSIATVGTTDFTAIGAPANTAGIIFTATGVGTGTGTADVFYSVSLPNSIADTIKNKFWRLYMNTSSGITAGGTGPGSPGAIPARFTNYHIAGTPVPPLSYTVNASPDNDTIAFPSMGITQAPGVVTITQQSIQLRDNLNPYGDFEKFGPDGLYPNTQNRTATTELRFNKGLRTTVNGFSSQIVTVDSFITINGDPTLQLYHFNNVDGGINEGTVTERVTGAQLDAQGYFQTTPAEYGASALHTSPAAYYDLNFPTTLPFSQWTMDFSLCRPSAPPRADGRFFTINRNLPYKIDMYVVDNSTDWDLMIMNIHGVPAYIESGNPMDVYIKWAIVVDLIDNSWSLFRNGVRVFNGAAIGDGQLLPAGTPTSIEWNMQLRPLEGGWDASPTDNGLLIDELRLTPRDLYGVNNTTYTTTPNEFSITDLYEATTVAQFPGMRVTPISGQQITIEPQHLIITDDDTVTMKVPSGNLALPRTLVFDPTDFTLTPSGVDNQVLTITSLGGGSGSASAPAYQAIVGHAGSVATVAIVNPLTGLVDGPHIGVEFVQDQTQSIAAGSFVVGRKYKIVTIGTTNFTTIGAVSNTIGTVFTATGVGTGTGTASPALTSTKIIATVTVTGGTVTNVEITYAGTGFFPGMLLTDNGNVSGGDPIILSVASTAADSTSSPLFQYDPILGTFDVNYDRYNDIAAVLPGAGRAGNMPAPAVQINAMSGRTGDAFITNTSGGSVQIFAGDAEYFPEVGPGTVFLTAGYGYGLAGQRGGAYLALPSTRPQAIPSEVVLQGGNAGVNLNGIRTISIASGGTGYLTGQFYDVPLIGGSGWGASVNVTVVGGVVTTVTVLRPGSGYQLTDTGLTQDGGLGGSGFAVDVATLVPYTITNGVASLDPYLFTPGSGYNPSAYGRLVPLLGGTGVGAAAHVTVDETGRVSRVVLMGNGNGYSAGDVLTTDFSLGAGSGFSVTVLDLMASGTYDVAADNTVVAAGSLLINGGTPEEIRAVGGNISGGSLILRTNQDDQLEITRHGEWWLQGEGGEAGQVITTNGPLAPPEWAWSDAMFRLTPVTGNDGVFDGTLFNDWNHVETDELYGSPFVSEDPTLNPGDLSFVRTGLYEIKVEVVATPTSPTDWPTGETIYGTELTFPLNDPTLIWQRKQHARFVDVAGSLNGTQRWTDVYHANVVAQLNNRGQGIPSTALLAGQDYRIAVVGTTDWTTVGAASNTVGEIFNATGPAAGTGIADGGNFIMRINAYADSGGTESVFFRCQVAIRQIGPGLLPS